MKTYRLPEAVLTMLVLSLLAIPAMATVATPTAVYGYITFEGAPAGGASVSLSDGQTATANNAGYYYFPVNNGSNYHITASFNGSSTSTSFTARGDRMEIDLKITTPSVKTTGLGMTYFNPSTPTPTSAPTVSPTLSPVISTGPQPTSYSAADPIDMAQAAETSGNPLQLLEGLVLLLCLAIIGYYLLLKGERQ